MISRKTWTKASASALAIAVGCGMSGTALANDDVLRPGRRSRQQSDAEHHLQRLELLDARPDHARQRQRPPGRLDVAGRHPRPARGSAARRRRHDVHRLAEAELRLRPRPQHRRRHQVGIPARHECRARHRSRPAAAARPAASTTPKASCSTPPSTARCSASTPRPARRCGAPSAPTSPTAKAWLRNGLVVGNLFIVGNEGGERGARGKVHAYDINTGNLQWVMYNMGPDNEVGITPALPGLLPRQPDVARHLVRRLLASWRRHVVGLLHLGSRRSTSSTTRPAIAVRGTRTIAVSGAS